MNPMIGGALIGAGGGLLGDLLSGGDSDLAKQVHHDNFYLATLGYGEQQRQFNENMAMQRDFAQNGIRMKMEDAKAAGIHPLAALGASGPAYSPVATSSMPIPDSYSPGGGGSPGGEFLRSMGQGIGRAVAATETAEERQINQAKTALALENASLQNDLLRSQITSIANATNPPIPSNSGIPLLTGQGDSGKTAPGGYVQENALQRTHSSPGVPAQEVGTVPDYSFAQTPTGLAIVPSKDVKERIEDQLIPELAWSFRNQLLPTLRKDWGPTPPDPKYYPLPKGYDEWRFNPFMQEFQPARFGESFWKKWTK